MSPRFLSQKMAQKEPEKKMPSTAAKAINLSAKDALLLSHHWRAHYSERERMGGEVSKRTTRCNYDKGRTWAFFCTQGIVSMAERILAFSALSLM